MLEYNHELLIPRSTSLHCGQRRVTDVKKKLILILNEFGISTKKTMLALSNGSNDNFNVGYIDKNVKNYLENKKRKMFEEGDA